MPITMARAGDTVRIKRISGRDEVKRHLESLGFVEGGLVNVVGGHGGNFILGIKESRVAIDKAMASRIMI